MAFNNVGELKDQISGILTGTNLDNVTNLDGCIERALGTFLLYISLKQISGRLAFSVYDGVYDYEAPDDIFGGVIYDIRPQGVDRSEADYTYKVGIACFDRTKATLPNGVLATFEYNRGTPIMRLAQTRARASALIDACNSSTGWVAGGDATGLAADTTNFYASPASLRFNLPVSGSSGYIEKTTSQQNLTDYSGVGKVFVAVNTPSATAVTSVGIRLGSSSTAYYAASVTTPVIGTAIANTWQLWGIDLAGATTTGSPVITAIDYTRVIVNYNGTALSNVRIGRVFTSLPTPFEMIYGSSACFLHEDGTITNKIEDDNDEVVLPDDAFVVFTNIASLEVLEQMGGDDAEASTASMKRKIFDPITGVLTLYKAKSPSEELNTTDSWYD